MRPPIMHQPSLTLISSGPLTILKVPIFHFYGNIRDGTERFSKDFIGKAMEGFKKRYPWESRSREARS